MSLATDDSNDPEENERAIKANEAANERLYVEQLMLEHAYKLMEDINVEDYLSILYIKSNTQKDEPPTHHRRKIRTYSNNCIYMALRDLIVRHGLIVHRTINAQRAKMFIYHHVMTNAPRTSFSSDDDFRLFIDHLDEFVDYTLPALFTPNEDEN